MKNKSISILLVVLIITAFGSCNSDMTVKSEEYSLSNEIIHPDFVELINEIPDELDFSLFDYTPGKLESTGKLELRWVRETDAPDAKLDCCYPTSKHWVLLDYNGQMVLVDPESSDYSATKADKFLEVKKVNIFPDNEKSGYGNRIPFCEVLGDYLFYHLDKTYIFDKNSRNLVRVLPNFTLSSTRYFVFSNYIFSLSSIGPMWRLSRYNISTGGVITAPGDIKSIHNINGEIWVNTEYHISSIDKETLYIKEDKMTGKATKMDLINLHFSSLQRII